VVHDRGVRKSAIAATEPAGRRCNGAGEDRKEIAQHAGVSRRWAAQPWTSPASRAIDCEYS
jgi:hypothetical protein